MENWRKRYHKNSAYGMIISISVHFAVLLLIFFLSKTAPPEDRNYYYINSYTVQLANTFSKDSNWGGGGSLGNATNFTGHGLSAPKTLAGIPVPSSEQSNIDFGLITNLEERKDSLSAIGSEMGTGSGTGIGSGSGSGIGDGSGWGIGYRSLPFVPRQILEVLPPNVEGAKGEIILLLKISIDGSIKEHKVIYNNTDDQLCLKNTIEAAYKSRWEKIKMEGTKIEYWIEKKYRFD